MPKGQVTLPDGRTISTVSAEYKQYLADNPQQRKAPPRVKKPGGKAAAPPSGHAAPPPDAETLSGFEPSDVPTGAPKAKSGAAPSGGKVKTKRQELIEDQGDLAELVAAGYASVAGLTGFDGWKITKDEADAIARPAGRILARHKHIDRAVKTVADPVALLAAIVIPTGVRLVLYREYVATQAKTKNVTPQAEPVRPGPPPPAPTRETGEDVPPARMPDPIAQATMMRLHVTP